MKRSEIKPGVEYAAQSLYRAGDPMRVVLVKHGVGGSYKLVEREWAAGEWRDVEPRIEWAPRGGSGVNTFRYVEPQAREMFRSGGREPVPYTAEFVEVRSKDVLGPYDEVVAERAAEKARRDEAAKRKAQAMADYAEQAEALRARLAAMGLDGVFAVDVNDYRPDPPRLRATVPAAEAIEALSGVTA